MLILEMNMETLIAQNPQMYNIIFTVLSFWSLIWKGLALWKAAGNKSKVWFVVLLIFNTLGILEILYYFFLYKVDFAKYTQKISLSPLLSKFKKGKIE